MQTMDRSSQTIRCRSGWRWGRKGEIDSQSIILNHHFLSLLPYFACIAMCVGQANRSEGKKTFLCNFPVHHHHHRPHRPPTTTTSAWLKHSSDSFLNSLFHKYFTIFTNVFFHPSSLPPTTITTTTTTATELDVDGVWEKFNFHKLPAFSHHTLTWACLAILCDIHSLSHSLYSDTPLYG